jgi:hypothetical protein
VLRHTKRAFDHARTNPCQLQFRSEPEPTGGAEPYAPYELLHHSGDPSESLLAGSLRSAVDVARHTQTTLDDVDSAVLVMPPRPGSPVEQ